MITDLFCLTEDKLTMLIPSQYEKIKRLNSSFGYMEVYRLSPHRSDSRKILIPISICGDYDHTCDSTFRFVLN
jgi:hypothetical protein